MMGLWYLEDKVLICIVKIVLTGGKESYGGDSSTVQAALIGVENIYSTGWAFAALLKDGTVVTWSINGFGGDSRKVQGGVDWC